MDEDGRRGVLMLAGTTLTTPGTLTLEADRLLLPVQTTQVDTDHKSEGRDWFWQRTQGEGASTPSANHVEVNASRVVTDVNSVQIELGTKAGIEALSQQPGMGWMAQLQNDPALAGKVDWQRVDDAVKRWDYKKEGLTQEGAVVIAIAVAWATAGAGSAAAGTTTAAAGGGTTTTLAGATLATTTAAGAVQYTALGAVINAGFTALATQTAIALADNRLDIGKTLKQVGSSQSVKGILTAMATAGVLSGMNLNPTGLPTEGGGAQKLMIQLGQNLQAGAARAVIGTAINGGSLGDNLQAGIKTALLDTMAAQGANAIGDISGPNGTLDAFTNKVAHAIAGCAAGAARTDSKAGCGAGAIGAAVGEMAAEAYGRKADTTQFASMMGGLAAALGGADAQGIGVASQAGANAAANNYLKHDEIEKLVRAQNACDKGSAEACKTRDDLKILDSRRQAEIAKACADVSGNECTTRLAEVAKDFDGLVDYQRSLQEKIVAGKLTYSESGNYLKTTAQEIKDIAGPLKDYYYVMSGGVADPSNPYWFAYKQIDALNAGDLANLWNATAAIGNTRKALLPAKKEASTSPSDAAAAVHNNFYRDGGVADPALPMSTSGPWKSVAELNPLQANARVAAGLPAGVVVNSTYSADAANQAILQANPNYKPSYMLGTEIVEFVTVKETKFVRVSGSRSDPTANWIMNAEDIAGLSPAQIAAKFALPAVPTQIGDVTIPAGIKLQASMANGILLGNNPGGGGVQFYIPMERRYLVPEWFGSVRQISDN